MISIMISKYLQYTSNILRKCTKFGKKRTETLGVANGFMVGGTMYVGFIGLIAVAWSCMGRIFKFLMFRGNPHHRPRVR